MVFPYLLNKSCGACQNRFRFGADFLQNFRRRLFFFDQSCNLTCQIAAVLFVAFHGTFPQRTNTHGFQCVVINVGVFRLGIPSGIGGLQASARMTQSAAGYDGGNVAGFQHQFFIMGMHRAFGGGQETGYRSGTENMPGIAAFSEAVRIKKTALISDNEKVLAVREAVISSLPSGVCVNLPKGEYLTNIISLTADGVKSEVLVRALSSEGICVSAGSACSSKKLKTSTALTAFGLTPDRADSTFRVSLSGENTVEEASDFCAALGEVIGRLAKKH